MERLKCFRFFLLLFFFGIALVVSSRCGYQVLLKLCGSLQAETKTLKRDWAFCERNSRYNDELEWRYAKIKEWLSYSKLHVNQASLNLTCVSSRKIDRSCCLLLLWKRWKVWVFGVFGFSHDQDLFWCPFGLAKKNTHDRGPLKKKHENVERKAKSCVWCENFAKKLHWFPNWDVFFLKIDAVPATFCRHKLHFFRIGDSMCISSRTVSV